MQFFPAYLKSLLQISIIVRVVVASQEWIVAFETGGLPAIQLDSIIRARKDDWIMVTFIFSSSVREKNFWEAAYMPSITSSGMPWFLTGRRAGKCTSHRCNVIHTIEESNIQTRIPDVCSYRCSVFGVLRVNAIQVTVR
jgi:hypothetical protein